MTAEVVITLCILAFMVIMLLTGKLPYGVTAMLCCVAFVLTGVADISTAFSGFSGSTVIMVATMMVVAQCLGKTSLIHRLRAALNSMQGKSGMILVGAILLITAALSQLMGSMACLSIMILFVQTLDDESEISPARMLFLAATMNGLWGSRIPVGMGATMPGTINSFVGGIAGEELLGITDYFKAGILPAIVGTIYCAVCFKLLPKSKMNAENNLKEVKDSVDISKKSEGIIFGVFICVMAGFMFSNQLSGEIVNILPAAGVLVLILTKVITVQETTRILTSDMVFMIAGMSAISSILSQVGVGELIGQFVLKILGGNPSGVMVVIVFCVVTSIMTNFMSNIGTMALMSPIAAATALEAGFNPATVVLVVGVSAMFAFCLPTGSSASMIGFGIGNFKISSTFRFTIPLLILEMAALIVSACLFFPLY